MGERLLGLPGKGPQFERKVPDVFVIPKSHKRVPQDRIDSLLAELVQPVEHGQIKKRQRRRP